jgi:hypothetical protein
MSLGGCIGAEAAANDILKMMDERLKVYKDNHCLTSLEEEFKMLRERIMKEIIDPAKGGWY